jgi:anti-anti-sigma regulatory factor
MADKTGTIRKEGVEVVALVGDEDDPAAVALAARLDLAMATGSHVVVDVSRAECLDKALAARLRSAHERLAGDGRAVALVVSPGYVAQTVHRLGLDRTLPMYITRAAAVAALSRGQPAGRGDA